MSKSGHIQIHLRVRPTKRPFKGLVTGEEDSQVEVHLSKKDPRQYVNNKKEDYHFKFDNVLTMAAKQDNVFDKVAKNIVDSVLNGYNGTIFAYGQTGSGKTFTITGGAERYADRGLIPRSVSYIFSEMRKRTDTHYQVSISYLEIYNDQGYDLLDDSQCTRNLQDLPKVIHREDEAGNISLYNLSVHRSDTEEDALNLLFIGDTNRVVAETPKHDASTRSHCVFVIQIEAQKIGSDVKTVSKLHLVDLAGSERVGKTNVDGVLLKEARYINVSLHFLEQVIVCLQKKSQGEQTFVPYRNSFMTLILRDSLGGNCKTAMIATISAEESDIDESISTCRFAQRVACIKNDATKNEQIDPALIIKRLKQENAELKAEIKMLKGDSEQKDHLTPEESEECSKMVEEYINNRDPSAKLVLSDILRINECFYHFKKMYNNLQTQSRPLPKGKAVDDVSSEEVERLRLLVQQRDNEIAILLSHLNKSKSEMPTSPPKVTRAFPTEEVKASETPTRRSVDSSARMRERSVAENKQGLMAPTNIELSLEQLQDRNKAFDVFRRSYRKNQAMEENKQLLKDKIQNAKNLTEVINSSRGRIEAIKNEIETLRRENALQGLVDRDNIPLEHPKEQQLSSELETQKATYRKGVAELRDLKSEIEGIQKMLENSRKRMQSDFEAWLQVMMKQSSSTNTSTVLKDQNVSDNLEAFYKAREQIYNKTLKK